MRGRKASGLQFPVMWQCGKKNGVEDEILRRV